MSRQASIESAVRICRSQRANAVAEQSGSLQPIGQPISASRNRGLQTRGRSEVPGPKRKIIRRRRESGGAPLRTLAGLKPRLRIRSHASVQDTVTVSIPDW